MTRAQSMLKHAHECISKREVTREYRTVVLNAATMVQSSGLAQALAFFAAKAKKEDAYAQLIKDLEAAPHVGSGLILKAATASASEYIRLTRLVVEQILYLKRMAIAYYEDKNHATKS